MKISFVSNVSKLLVGTVASFSIAGLFMPSPSFANPNNASSLPTLNQGFGSSDPINGGVESNPTSNMMNLMLQLQTGGLTNLDLQQSLPGGDSISQLQAQQRKLWCQRPENQQACAGSTLVPVAPIAPIVPTAPAAMPVIIGPSN
jgi:hypothetical protein